VFTSGSSPTTVLTGKAVAEEWAMQVDGLAQHGRWLSTTCGAPGLSPAQAVAEGWAAALAIDVSL